MSVKAMTWAWEQEGLTDGEKLCLMALADHANDEGTCYPSNGTVGKKLGIEDRAVRKRIEKLEAKGVLRREKRERENGSTSTNLVILALNGPGPNEPPGPVGTGPEPTTSVSSSKREPSSSEDQQCLEGVDSSGKVSSRYDVQVVFDCWKDLYGGPRVTLTKKRATRIKSRLDDGRSPKELCEALKGAAHDDWLMGRKEGSPGYTGIETLLRDDDQVHRLIKLHQNPPASRPGGKGKSYERDRDKRVDPGW